MHKLKEKTSFLDYFKPFETIESIYSMKSNIYIYKLFFYVVLEIRETLKQPKIGYYRLQTRRRGSRSIFFTITYFKIEILAIRTL